MNNNPFSIALCRTRRILASVRAPWNFSRAASQVIWPLTNKLVWIDILTCFINVQNEPPLLFNFSKMDVPKYILEVLALLSVPNPDVKTILE